MDFAIIYFASLFTTLVKQKIKMVFLGFNTTQANICTMNFYMFSPLKEKYERKSMVTVYFGESQCGKHIDSAYTVNWQAAPSEMLVCKAIKVLKMICCIKIVN